MVIFVLLSDSFGILRELFPMAYALLMDLLIFKFSPMSIGLVIHLIEDLFLGIVCFLAPILFIGLPRNSLPLLAPPLKPNTGL